MAEEQTTRHKLPNIHFISHRTSAQQNLPRIQRNSRHRDQGALLNPTAERKSKSHSVEGGQCTFLGQFARAGVRGEMPPCLRSLRHQGFHRRHMTDLSKRCKIFAHLKTKPKNYKPQTSVIFALSTPKYMQCNLVQCSVGEVCIPSL